MSEWKECSLGDVAELINGFAFKSAEFSDNGVPVIKIKNVASGKLLFNDIQFYPYEITEKLKPFILKKGDILIAMTGSHVHQPSSMVGRVTRYDRPFVALLNQRVGKIVSRQLGILDEDFIYYFLKQEDVTIDLAVNAGGSANQANVSSEQIRNLSILLPPISEQRAIAGVLSSLDYKIDLLHRQNKTLEGMAEALWRKMFVEEADAQWDEVSLLDIIDLVGGGTPKTDVVEYWGGSIHWLAAKDITGNHKSFIIQTEKTITEAGLDNSSAKILPKYATIISARGTVGNYCILATPMAFSQSNYGILPKIRECYFFTYLLIAHVIDELKMAAYGSVFDTITTNTFKEQKVKVPSKDQIVPFEEGIKPYFNKIYTNTIQMRTLSRLRDTLLPKLMSGEVRMNL